MSVETLMDFTSVRNRNEQAVFDTVDLTAFEWGISVAVASTTLILEEVRKSLVRFFARETAG